jgi:hypothetical protein
VTTLVRKVAFRDRITQEKWLFEAKFGEFSGPSFAGASRGLWVLGIYAGRRYGRMYLRSSDGLNLMTGFPS